MKKIQRLILTGILAVGASALPAFGTQAASGNVTIDAENFPDVIFRNYVSSEFDTNSDGELSEEEITAVTCIEVDGKGISDLTGVGEFTSLQDLSCFNNSLIQLDVTKNTSLVSLNCGANKLTELNVSNNTELTTLNCGNNGLSDLDVSYNKKLEILICSHNNLKSLDVGNNTELVDLGCGINFLEKLDLSRNQKLETLGFSQNYLKSIDLSANTELKSLNCRQNRITGLDLSNNVKLESVLVQENSLTDLNVSKCTALTSLECNDNQIGSLDLSGNTALKTLYCYRNSFTSLDVSHNTVLRDFRCGNSPVSELDLRKNTNLNYLYCNGTNLTDLDVSNNTLLRLVCCTDCSISELDVSGNANLTAVLCNGNQMNKLNIGSNAALASYIDAGGTVTGEMIKYGIDFDHRIQVDKNTVIVRTPIIGSAVSSGTSITVDWTSMPGASKYALERKDGNNEWVTVSDDIEENSFIDTGLAEQTEYTYRIKAYFDGGGWSHYSTTVNAETGFADVVINETTFPDDNFRNYVSSELDADSDGVLSSAEITAVKEIRVSSRQIRDMTGVGVFKLLTYLDCSYNRNMKHLDVSKNKELTYLNCDATDILELDVSGMADLNHLSCGGNFLKTLDLSNNTGLDYLRCSGNSLSSVDVGGLTALTHLECNQNKLTTLDVSKNTELTFLSCAYNNLTALDVSKNTKLLTLSFYFNNLTELDTTNNTVLNSLFCSNNSFEKLDVSKNQNLQYLNCDNNSLSELDLSNNTKLIHLYCYNNYLTELELSHNTALRRLSCSGNQLTYLDLSGIKNPDEIGCDGNQMEILIIGSNAGLKRFIDEGELETGETYLRYSFGSAPSWRYFRFDNTAVIIRTPDISGIVPLGTKITVTWTATPGAVKYALERKTGDGDWITVSDSIGTTVYTDKGLAEETVYTYRVKAYYNGGGWSDYSTTVSAETELDGVSIDENTFPDDHFRSYVSSQLDTDGNARLSDEEIAAVTKMVVSNREISDLTGIELFTELTSLDCSTNSLTSLDMRSNTKLKSLTCYTNQLATLFINEALTYLYCPINQLTSLDLSANKGLTYLECSGNNLTELDVSNNTGLKTLYCVNNKLTDLDVHLNTEITFLECAGNQLTELDVSSNLKLHFLSIRRNSISDIDLTANKELDEFLCNMNNLTDLDMSPNTKLRMLGCSGNRITKLDVSRNPKLIEIDCDCDVLNIGENAKFAALLSQEGVMTGNVIYYHFESGESMYIRTNTVVVRTPVVDSAKADTKGITVTWNAAPGAGKYMLYRREGSGSWVKLSASLTGTGYTDMNVTPGKKYTYRIKAYFTGGDWSNYSATVSAVAVPTAPVFSSVTASDGQITIGWNAIESVKKYAVYRRAYNGNDWGSWTVLNSKLTDTQYVDSNITVNTKYQYRVRAYNAAGWGGYGMTDPIQCVELPQAPDSVMAEAGTDRITIAWSAVNGAGKYALYRRVFDGNSWGGWKSISTKLTALVYEDTDVSVGNKYQYRVSACNAGGWGGYCASLVIQPKTASGPAAPETVKAVAYTTKISISWSPVEGATKYALYRREYTNSRWGSWSKVDATLTVTSYADTTVKSGKKYQYKVMAYNEAGWGKTTASNGVVAK